MNRLARQHFWDSSAATTSRRVALRALGSAGFAAALVLGAGRSAAAQNTEEVVREAVEALNLALSTGDDSGLDALVASDVTVEPRHRMLATGEEVSDDLAGLKAALADMRNIASDIELVVDDLISEDDKVAGRFTVRGRPGASGQPLEGRGLVFAVVANDLVTELWIYPDPYLMTDVMALVGMATPMPSA